MAEQNNFAISEFINNKKAESNYEPIKNKVDNVIINFLAFILNVKTGVETAMGVQQDAHWSTEEELKLKWWARK